MSIVLNHYTYPAPMDYYSRHSNMAGAPLPRIPRRSSTSRTMTLSSQSVQDSPSPPATVSRELPAETSSSGTVPTFLVVQPPTPPRPERSPSEGPAPDEASSSSSGSESYVQMNPRVKRTRTPKMQPFRAPADSTPTPAVFQAKAAKGVAFPAQEVDESSGNETPRASSSHFAQKSNFQISLDDLKKPLALAGELTTSGTSLRAGGSSGRAASTPNATAANIARKKSGEPLKSSLKSRRPVVRGDLSVVTGAAIPSTKSEPSTPMTSKSVHFDSRLEHVKLFLAEQKPLAISREGSPTDTSGTESDFPSAIYGSKKEDDTLLTIQLANKPLAPSPEADLALEDISLSEDGTCLNGRARVRNLAFEKWVAVRFTVDSWQTTSEVTAKYHDSVPGGVFDRFAFTIRLGDMLARIEEKTLFFALRYNVTGREIWDNNRGENYKVTFSKVPRPRPVSASTSETGIASLKSKLENVVKGQETVGAFMAHGTRQKAPFPLDANTSLSARYDFAVSWKSPWQRSPQMTSPTKSGHARNVTYPNALPHVKRNGKQPMFDDSAAARFQLTRGSPRALDAWDASPVERPSYFANELDDTPVPIMSRRRDRNHQRGYFDLGLSQVSPSVRMTPTGSPTEGRSPRPSPERNPVPPRASTQGLWFLDRGGSEESTPSVTSNSESSQSSSPSESPTDDMTFGFGGVRSPSESDSYSSFLSKYCYYTGTSSSSLDVAQDVIHRSHSASSVEEFLSASPSASYLLSPGETPTRSSSFDDVMSMSSGSTTPTSRSMNFTSLVNSPQMVSAN